MRATEKIRATCVPLFEVLMMMEDGLYLRIFYRMRVVYNFFCKSGSISKILCLHVHTRNTY